MPILMVSINGVLAHSLCMRVHFDNLYEGDRSNATVTSEVLEHVQICGDVVISTKYHERFTLHAT